MWYKRGIKWFLYTMKRQVKTPFFWIMLFFFSLVCVLFLVSAIPGNSTTKVLLYGNEKDELSKEIIKNLCENNKTFQFERVYSEEELETKVSRMEAESGLLFAKDLTKRAERDNLEDCITYVSTPTSLQSEVIKEAVYAAFFRAYSPILLRQLTLSDKIYERPSDEVLQKVLRAEKKYEQNDAAFSFTYKNAEQLFHTKSKNMDVLVNEKNKQLQGCLLFFLFAAALLSYGKIVDKKEMYLIVPLSYRLWFRLFELWGTLFPLTIAAFIFLCQREGLEYAGSLLLNLLLFDIICLLWIAALGKIMRTSIQFYCIIPAILLACVVFSPLFFHIENYLPAVRYMKWLFPTTYFFS